MEEEAGAQAAQATAQIPRGATWQQKAGGGSCSGCIAGLPWSSHRSRPLLRLLRHAGAADENEIVIAAVLQGFYDSVTLLLRNAVEKKTVRRRSLAWAGRRMLPCAAGLLWCPPRGFDGLEGGWCCR